MLGCLVGAMLLVGWFVDSPRLYHPLLAITLLLPSFALLLNAVCHRTKGKWKRRKRWHLLSLGAGLALLLYYLLALYLKFVG